MGADPRSTANFAGKEKEKKEKEIASSVTGTGEKKPQVGESSKESGKDEMENSHYQRVQRVRNKVSDFVRNSYGDSCEACMSPCPEPMSPILKNNESKVQIAWTFHVSRQLI